MDPLGTLWVIFPPNGEIHVTVTGVFSGCHLVRIVGLHRVNICHGVDLHFLVILGKKLDPVLGCPGEEVRINGYPYRPCMLYLPTLMVVFNGKIW